MNNNKTVHGGKPPSAKNKYISKRLVEKATQVDKLNSIIKERDTTIKQQDDKINAQASHINELESQLSQYQEQEGFIITQNNGYITHLHYNPSYNEWIELQDLPLENIEGIVKTALYRKFPFLKRNGNKIELDEQQYRKYKIGGTL